MNRLVAEDPGQPKDADHEYEGDDPYDDVVDDGGRRQYAGPLKVPDEDGSRVAQVRNSSPLRS